MVNGRRVTAIVDTGAEKNVITRETLRYFRSDQSRHRNLLVAGGGKIPILGQAQFHLGIEGHTVRCNANVIDKLPFPLLLGMEFLEKYETTINLKHGTVSMIMDGRFLNVRSHRDNKQAPKHYSKNYTVSSRTYNRRQENGGSGKFTRRKYENTMPVEVNATWRKNERHLRHMESGTSERKRKVRFADSTNERTEANEKRRIDPEFDKFFSGAKDYNYEIIKASIEEKTMDLFKSPKGYTLAHCVSADLKMGAGIARIFKEKFGGIEALRRQNQRVGGLAVLEEGNRFICYMVTKQYFWEEPELRAVWSALNNLREFVEKHNITKLAMPTIGCGKDRLEWKTVKRMITHVFRNTAVDLLICHWSTEEKILEYNRESPIVHKENNLELTLQSTENETLPIKVVLEKDYILAPNKVYELEVSTRIPETGISNKQWILKNKEQFYYSRGLLKLDSFQSAEVERKIRVINKRNQMIKVFKGTTVAYLIPEKDDIPQEGIVLYLGDEDDEMTLADHDLDHIKNTTQKTELEELLGRYSDVFSKSTRKMGRTALTKHKIDVENAHPIKSRPYRVSAKEREIIDGQIKEMLANDVIRPSHSPWSSPVVLVKKKDGTTRFCVDYRRLNEVTKKSTYPIPNIEDILTYLGGSKYFTTLDMLSGYWQVEVEENSKEYTAFVAQGHGLYEFNVLSFGLCNAPATFQHLADIVFEGMKWKDVLIYLDDIVVFSRTWEEHLEKLERVFQRLREANLTLKPSKCVYVKERVKLLGHIVSANGVAPDEEKLKAIKDFPVPKTVKNIQSFVGLCNYYRQFVPNFASIARPLHLATKKSTGFAWGPDQHNAFETLKEKLITAPVLQHFSPQEECELRVDACTTGIGAILLQPGENGQMHPVAYASRSLSKAEENYSITDLEALAAIWAMTSRLRHLVHGRPIRIVTDHHALCWIKTAKEGTGRLARWALKLSEFEYKVVYKNGTAHADADALSRNPVSVFNEREDEIEELPTFLLQSEDIAQEQLEDPLLEELVQAVKKPEEVSIGLAKRSKNFRLIDGVLYKVNPSPEGRENLLVVPRHLKGEILYQHHSEPLAGHLGVAKTINKLKKVYYWENMQKDVEKFIRGCADCQSRKGQQNQKPVGLLQPIPIGTPFEKVGIDLLGPFRKSKNGMTTIVVATDYATRWVETEALPSGKALPVAKFILEKIITRHGSPKHLLSDRGQTFRSEVVRELLKCMGTYNQFTTAYHPSCNGLTERFNKTLANMLSMYTNTEQSDWDEYLPLVTFAYNTSRQDTTQFSPFMLVYGREPVLPTEASLLEPCKSTDANEIRERALAVRAQAVINIHKKQEFDKLRYDSRHRHLEFSAGEQVKVFTPVRKVGRSEKLMLRWFGPYKVIKKISDVDYLIQKGLTTAAKEEVVHVSRILPYHDPWTPTPEPEQEME